jgi:hypothetical protein
MVNLRSTGKGRWDAEWFNLDVAAKNPNSKRFIAYIE